MKTIQFPIISKLPVAVTQGMVHIAQAFLATATTVLVSTICSDIKSHTPFQVRELIDAALAGGTVSALTTFAAFLSPAPSQNVTAPQQTITTTVPLTPSVTTTQVTVHEDPVTTGTP